MSHYRVQTSGSVACHDEAERLSLEVVELQRRVLGPNHPDTADSLYNLACSNSVRGRRDQALDWLRQALDAGFSDAELLADDTDLDSIRDDPRFRALASRLRAIEP